MFEQIPGRMGLNREDFRRTLRLFPNTTHLAGIVQLRFTPLGLHEHVCVELLLNSFDFSDFEEYDPNEDIHLQQRNWSSIGDGEKCCKLAACERC